MSKPRQQWFSFDLDDGSGMGLTSGPWTLKGHGDSVYLLPKLLPDWKLALHAQNLWMFEITKEAIEHGRVERPATPGGRGVWKFAPPQISDEPSMIFALGVARSALLPRQRFEHVTSLPASRRWDQLNVASAWTCGPGHEPPLTDVVGEPQRLRDGRTVWMSVMTETWPEEDASVRYRGSILEPIRPESHGVRAPGLLITGVSATKPGEAASRLGPRWGPANPNIGGVVFQPVDLRDLLAPAARR